MSLRGGGLLFFVVGENFHLMMLTLNRDWVKYSMCVYSISFLSVSCSYEGPVFLVVLVFSLSLALTPAAEAHTVQALPAAEAPSPKAHAWAKRWRSIHFPTCVNEKQEMKKEGTENVCAHLAPTALAYLLSKSMTHFHNQQYPTKAKRGLTILVAGHLRKSCRDLNSDREIQSLK
jgi:hypothetical protein